MSHKDSSRLPVLSLIVDWIINSNRKRSVECGILELHFHSHIGLRRRLERRRHYRERTPSDWLGLTGWCEPLVRCLIPASPAKPAATGEHKNDKNDDEKRGRVHGRLRECPNHLNRLTCMVVARGRTPCRCNVRKQVLFLSLAPPSSSQPPSVDAMPSSPRR